MGLMTWRAQSAGRFYDPGESSVVYFDTSSGDTHLISDFAARLTELLQEQPMTTSALMARISPETDAQNPAELEDSMIAVLNELVTLDILKRD
tara:strand:+ start:27874 stop:28152 length:279 start_codon:yes stop_codon:yes gene_type:complete